MDPPSGRVPEQGPNWFLVATKARGGGTPNIGYFLEVSVFIEIFYFLQRSPTPRSSSMASDDDGPIRLGAREGLD